MVDLIDSMFSGAVSSRPRRQRLCKAMAIGTLSDAISTRIKINSLIFSDVKFSDSINARTIGTFMPVTGTMSVQKCADTCHTNGFVYAGVEYADECCTS